MFQGLLDLICPPVCPGCGDQLEGDEPFCTECQSKIATPKNQICPRCGAMLLQPKPDATQCDRCRRTPFIFNRIISLGEYQREWRYLILKMKTDRGGVLATAAAKLLVELRRDELTGTKFDAIIPIPMYWMRRWERGVNSPDVVAEELGRQLKIPVWRNRLRRVRRTGLQYLLSVRNRQQNLENAFLVTKPDLLFGKNILLVDDILTTGSTCNEAARALRRVGVRSVTVCVLARAIGDWYRKKRQYLLGDEKW